MRNQKGVSLIALIITIIVIIILAAIVMNAGGNTIGEANYSSFVQQFGEYADQVSIDSAQVMAAVGKKGKSINTAQRYHMVANGQKDLNSGDMLGAFGYQMPIGYVIPETIREALNLPSGENDTVAYLITDNKITGYERKANLDFYGDSNGVEQHFVTNTGVVFTIPGFAEEQENGSINYYVTSKGDHYVVKGTSTGDYDEVDPILSRDFTELYGVDLDGKSGDDEAIKTASKMYNGVMYVAGEESDAPMTILTKTDTGLNNSQEL